MHIEDWCDDIVAAFALQAMIGVLGIENVAEWCQRQPAPVSQTDIATVGEEPPYAAADDEAMEVEDEEAQETREVREGEVGRDSVPVSAPPPNCRSLVVAFQQYQSAEGETAMHLPVVGETERESYAKRAVQLISQLCLVDLPLLAGFVDLHSVWAMSANPALDSSVKNDGDERKVDISDKEDADTSDVKEDAPADIETSGGNHEIHSGLYVFISVTNLAPLATFLQPCPGHCPTLFEKSSGISCLLSARETPSRPSSTPYLSGVTEPPGRCSSMLSVCF